MSQGSRPTPGLALMKRAALCQYAACKGISYEEAEQRLEVREFDGGIAMRVLGVAMRDLGPGGMVTVGNHPDCDIRTDLLITGADGKPAGHIPVADSKDSP